MPTLALAPSELRAAATTYPGMPEQVRRVRADARSLLDGCPAADDVIICISELAANAVQHSNSRRPGGTFTVRVESCPGAYVRIEVEDDGGPWIARALDLASGRGLDIVGALTAEWGITATPAGRCAWAHIDWSSGR
jgi:serine/threonine-protein kinase RsbW